MRPRHAARVQRPRGQTPEAIRPEPQTSTTRSRTDTLAHRQATRPPTHTRKSRSEYGPRSFHTPDVRTPLAGNRGTVLGCLVEARVSEPGSGTRTLLLRVPGMKYLGGGFVRQYVNNICPDIIEQISCLSFSCEDFFGKILSYIVWGCMLGLMSAELIIQESRSLFRKSFSRDRATTGVSLRIDVGRKQRTPSMSVSASIR